MLELMKDVLELMKDVDVSKACGYENMTSVAKAMKVLRKLGCCLQIEVGIV